MTGDLSFNSFLLQTNNIITNVIDHTEPADQVTGILAIANANRSAITSINSPNRTISIAGVIKGSSHVDLDQRIDTFKSYFNGKNKNLDINYAGSTRRYIATKNSISIELNGALKFASFKVQFICTEPFGIDTTESELFSENTITTSSFTASPVVGGNALYQLPVFIITINSLTGTGDYIQISNNANNENMLIMGHGLANGDVLIIDGERRRVTLNDIPIDYNGVFFELEPGNASITYSDGFITRDVDILAKYYKRYL